MNTATHRLASILATLLALAVLIPSSGFAQISSRKNGEGNFSKAHPKVQMNPNKIKINQRTPILFRPFELKDKTGNPIPPNSMITLRNGKKVTAKQHVEALNELEKKLNALGYSLRSPQSKITIQETLSDRAKTLDQSRLLSTAPLRTKPISVIRSEHHAKGTFDQQRLAKLASLVSLPPKTVKTVKSWSKSLGDRDTLAVSTDATLELNGSLGATSVDAEANAGCSIVGEDLNIIRASANLNAPKSGNMNAKLDVSVVGNSLWTVNKNTNLSWSESRDLSKSFKKGFEWHFMIGPIPVSAEIGAAGTFGSAYYIGVRPTSATAVLSPTLRSDIYVQAAVDLSEDFGLGSVGAEAGGEGSLILIKDDLSIWGEVELNVDATGKPYILEVYQAQNDLEALRGSLKLYAEVCGSVLGFGDCKRFEWEFLNLPGYKDSRILFNGNNKTFF